MGYKQKQNNQESYGAVPEKAGYSPSSGNMVAMEIKNVLHD